MAQYTKQEVAAINAAWRAISHLCSCTNWSDPDGWREAEKLERRQAADFKQATTWARAMICNSWAHGFDNPDVPARNLYYIRPGALIARLLGVRHAVERANHHYNGPMVREARTLCEAALAADRAHSQRIADDI